MDWSERWPDFTPSEVLSPDGLFAYENDELVLSLEALDFLQDFRFALDAPILVNHGLNRLRGYRSPKENESIRGARFSYHMQGVAFDITVPSMPLDSVLQAAINFGWHGIGYYPKRNFIHLDLRPRLDERLRRWNE